ncbi:unnamed protein product [Ectocarpus sp. 4 AP-2014]
MPDPSGSLDNVGSRAKHTTRFCHESPRPEAPMPGTNPSTTPKRTTAWATTPSRTPVALGARQLHRSIMTRVCLTRCWRTTT